MRDQGYCEACRFPYWTDNDGTRRHYDKRDDDHPVVPEEDED